MQTLIRDSSVCESNELRSFLSQSNISLPRLDSDPSKRLPAAGFPGQGLVRSLYRTVTTGIDDMLGTSAGSIVDTVIARLSQQAADIAGLSGSGVQDEDLLGQLSKGANATPGASPSTTLSPRVAGTAGEEGLTYFTAPICDLFVTLFQLKEKNNWLRRQAVLIILQQVLGGTIER